MSVSNLVTALSVIFAVSIVALAGELLYVLWCRRTFRRHSSPPPPLPIRSGDGTPDFSTADSASKELLYFFCFKPDARVDLSGPPNKNTDGSWPDDQVVDVFKLLEANGPSRFLSTIKEEDKDDVESTPEVDFAKTKNVCLESCLQIAGEPLVAAETETEAEAEAEEVVVVTVNRDDGNTKTVFSTPCDTPSYFTPVGSPSRDFMESEFVVSVDHETGKNMSDDEFSACDYV